MSSLPTENENNKNHASQYGLIREIDYSVEMIKLKLCERLDELKEIFVNKAAAAKSSQPKTKKSESPFVKGALFSFYEAVSKELDSLSPEILNKQRPFSPFLANVLEVKANIGFNYGANSYSQKHNMIITCPSNSTVHFYDATTLLPLKQRNRVQLKSSVVQMSFCPETDTYLMGCAYGDIYSYDASSNNIKRVLKHGESFVLAISFINSTHYAFSSCKSGQLFIGNLETEGAVPLSFGSKDSDSWYLHHLNQRNLLFSGLANGSVILYHTSKLPKLPVLASIQAHKIGKYVTTIQNVMINKKEFIITGGNDHTIKIWHLIKGKMRLLKVLQIEEDISCMVYLEDYKMIATTHHREYIKFFSLPSGKLQSTLKLDMSKSRNVFLMKDKNTIGVADLAKNIIKMVQLHLPEDNALLREL